MTAELLRKKEKLAEQILSLGKIAVAFSAGVDSTFLLKMCSDILGGSALALTCVSPLTPAREQSAAAEFCRENGIKQIVISPDLLSLDVFAENPPDRCYHCKKALFCAIIREAEKEGINTVADGSNADDTGDYRPGMRALEELGVISPLKEAGLTKADIRALSKEMGLPTWSKPSYACLATRIEYGEPVTAGKLGIIEKAEQKLFELGFTHARVRMHGSLARIEVDKDSLCRLADEKTAGEINSYLRSLGFLYVTADLAGYESGSMNRALAGIK